jgi:hypothetical protein
MRELGGGAKRAPCGWHHGGAVVAANTKLGGVAMPTYRCQSALPWPRMVVVVARSDHHAAWGLGFPACSAWERLKTRRIAGYVELAWQLCMRASGAAWIELADCADSRAVAGMSFVSPTPSLLKPLLTTLCVLNVLPAMAQRLTRATAAQ